MRVEHVVWTAERGWTHRSTSRSPGASWVAGDGPRFGTTQVGLDSAPTSARAVAVGLYGDRLRVGHGSVGGWRRFGPERLITRAEGNVLYELDVKSALDLYQRYLGEESAGLPGTALLYPLAIRRQDSPATELVRTIVADLHNQTMTITTFSEDALPGERTEWSA